MQFFEAMDKNALWCRGTLQYIQAISSHNSERFDLAAKWQQALDDNNQQNLVYSVLEVCPAKLCIAIDACAPPSRPAITASHLPSWHIWPVALWQQWTKAYLILSLDLA